MLIRTTVIFLFVAVVILTVVSLMISSKVNFLQSQIDFRNSPGRAITPIISPLADPTATPSGSIRKVINASRSGVLK